MVHPIHSGSFTVPIHWWMTTPSSKQVTLVVKQTIELEKDKSKRCCFEKQQNSVPKGYTLMPSKCTYTLMFTFCHFRQNKRDKVVTRLQLKDITLNLRSRSHVEKGPNYFTWKTIWTSLAFCPGCQDAMQVINLCKLTFWMSVWPSQELSLHFCLG